ncbi:hypothetical protein Mal48_01980 [Thalassoglobus polymorphus]|uniref:Uncharacterized protein n=1 Tax=Thalassoglobus polymorphus TaxID=2527994 RepID=A0A517QH63_9PLAN|nr:hypothetical protein Mal48_01530 [Thalassoglobus polymorphus]QDT30969.1 hypothetical protein Mal48_01980 [Thalassoglobus polymorphus]
MIEPILVGFVQFFYILLLGLQSRFVRDGQKVHAAITSFLLGLSVLFVQPAIIRAAILEPSADVLIAFVIAGPAGICAGMFLHDKFFCNS